MFFIIEMCFTSFDSFCCFFLFLCRFRKNNKTVYQHFRNVGFGTICYCVEWFTTCFIVTCPGKLESLSNLFIYIFIYLFIYSFNYLFIYLFIHLFNYLFIYLSVYLFNYLFIYLIIYSFI